eukprot:4789261-Prymnesium_polylepis.2
MKNGALLADSFVIKSHELVQALVDSALVKHANDTLMMLAPPLRFLLRARRAPSTDGALGVARTELVVTGHFFGLVAFGPRWAFDDERFSYKETNKLSHKKALALAAQRMDAAAVAAGAEAPTPPALAQFLAPLLAA